MQTITLNSNSLEDTLTISKRLGSNLHGGEVIELLSDLGGGKTSLVKGLAKGAGSENLVSSPSFTIVNEYQAAKFKIYHFDFYRLSEPGIIRRELSEVLEEPGNVIVVEWPEVVEDSLPKEHIGIAITATGNTKRQLKISYPDNLAYLVKGLA
jgi:tRNA threonylcarbamoyladenosine biosynthesis protein TsaE